MKALVILMSILLVAFFSFTPAFGQPKDANQVKSVEPAKELKAADANAIDEPNAVRAKIEKFEGLGEELKNIDEGSRNEISEWTQGKLDDRLDLALAAQKQITAELKLLREIAIEEGAAKTTAAIDGILLDRQERFKSVIEKLEKENRRVIEREEKRKELRERSIERNRERPERRRDSQQQTGATQHNQ